MPHVGKHTRVDTLLPPPPPATSPLPGTAKIALITGITGQDGSYLAELLLEKGYMVSPPAPARPAPARPTFWRFVNFNALNKPPRPLVLTGAVSRLGVWLPSIPAFDAPAVPGGCLPGPAPLCQRNSWDVNVQPIPVSGEPVTVFSQWVLLSVAAPRLLFKVHGIIRRSSSFNTGRIAHLFDNPVTHTQKQMKLHYGDLSDSTCLVKLVAMIRPDEASPPSPLPSPVPALDPRGPLGDPRGLGHSSRPQPPAPLRRRRMP